MKFKMPDLSKRRSLEGLRRAAAASVRNIGFVDPTRVQAMRPESAAQSGAGSVRSWLDALQRRSRDYIRLKIR